MSPKEQQIAIAIACGWRKLDIPRQSWDVSFYWDNPAGHYIGGGSWNPLPDYLNDRNAMHGALEILTVDQGKEFIKHLWGAVARYETHDIFSTDAAFLLVAATPEKMAIAFLKTLNLWKI